MRSKIQQWGNSLSRHSDVDLSLDEGRLVGLPAEESRLSRGELLAQVTDDNRHSEIDTGPPVGKEIW